MKPVPLLLICCNAVFAQADGHIQRTNINSFVERSSVTWAMNADDTSGTANDFMVNYLWPRYQSKKIKGYYVPWDKNINFKYTYPYKSFFAHTLQNSPIYDSTGTAHTMKPDTTGYYARSIPRKSILFQILYAENNKLRSYISFISPGVSVNTMDGMLLGYSYTLGLCMNKAYNQTASSPDKLISIGKTKKTIITDSIPAEQRLKEMYSNNLIRSVWPGIISGKTISYSALTGEKLSLTQIEDGDIKGLMTEEIPVYDSVGDFIRNRSVTPEFSCDSFKKIEIVQEWYYDPVKDIIFCKIPEAYLYTDPKIMEEKHTGKALIRIAF